MTITSPPDPESTAKIAAQERTTSAWVRSFIESLPLSFDAREFVTRLRDALARYLPMIDRITVDVNVRSQIPAGDGSAPHVSIREHVSEDPDAGSQVFVSTDAGRRADELIEEMRVAGFPVAEYRAPYVQEYPCDDGGYLGTIILWNRHDKRGVDNESIALLRGLDRTIRFLLSDCAARHQCSQPYDRAFYAALEELSQSARLTTQECRILLYRLLGHQYKEIADRMGIRTDTVTKHIRAVHVKTGTHSITDIFAKYFTPRMEVRESYPPQMGNTGWTVSYVG